MSLQQYLKIFYILLAITALVLIIKVVIDNKIYNNMNINELINPFIEMKDDIKNKFSKENILENIFQFKTLQDIGNNLKNRTNIITNKLNINNSLENSIPKSKEVKKDNSNENINSKVNTITNKNSIKNENDENDENNENDEKKSNSFKNTPTKKSNNENDNKNEIPKEPTTPTQLRKKEVYNISENIFTYDQAEKVCKKYGAELATKAQVDRAYKEGANWCNFGWTQGQMALYPIQKEYYNKLIKDKDRKDDCGKPGVNGGYFQNKNIEFGVNCYGIKPLPKKDNIKYSKPKPKTTKPVERAINVNEININPFNNNKWSRRSQRNSKYYIYPHEKYRVQIVNGIIKDPRNVQVDTTKGNIMVSTKSKPLLSQKQQDGLICSNEPKQITEEDLEKYNFKDSKKNEMVSKNKVKVGDMFYPCAYENDIEADETIVENFNSLYNSIKTI